MITSLDHVQLAIPPAKRIKPERFTAPSSASGKLLSRARWRHVGDVGSRSAGSPFTLAWRRISYPRERRILLSPLHTSTNCESGLQVLVMKS